MKPQNIITLENDLYITVSQKNLEISEEVAYKAALINSYIDLLESEDLQESSNKGEKIKQIRDLLKKNPSLHNLEFNIKTDEEPAFSITGKNLLDSINKAKEYKKQKLSKKNWFFDPWADLTLFSITESYKEILHKSAQDSYEKDGFIVFQSDLSNIANETIEMLTEEKIPKDVNMYNILFDKINRSINQDSTQEEVDFVLKQLNDKEPSKPIEKLKNTLIFRSANSLMIFKSLHKEFSADINSRDLELATPLHYAASTGSAEVIRYIIENGGEINAQDINGRTALHQAIEDYSPTRGRDTMPVIDLLLKLGIDTSIQNNNQQTALAFTMDKKPNASVIIQSLTNGITDKQSIIEGSETFIPKFPPKSGILRK